MENTYLKATKFDEMVTDKNLWIIKALIPYLPNNLGYPMSVYAKFSELKKTLYICKNPLHMAENDDISLQKLLSVLKDYMDESQAENIEMLMSLLEMMSYSDDSSDMMENMMNMFMNNEKNNI